MADKKSPQVVVGGCLSSVFTLFGLFLLATTLISQFTRFNGPGVGFELTGAFIPAIVLLVIGRLVKRGVDRSVVDEAAQIPPPRHPARPSGSSVERPPSIGETPPPSTVAEPPKPEPDPLEIPELGTLEEPIPPLLADDAFDFGDLRSEQPMSSEERIRRAKERFNKKKG